jgi:uncharacterized protein YdaT
MPWTPESFKRKHDKTMTEAQAKKAARIANAILADSGDEGLAIATAIKKSKKGRKK